jgi:GT2 family glycosyltransferase
VNVSAVVVTYNAGDELEGCLDSLEGQDGLIETIVVDNGSSDDSVETNRGRFPDATFVELGRNLGYTGAANRGASRASGELILFLNADTRLAPDALSLLRREFADAGVGVVGPRIELSKADNPEFGYTIDALGSTVALTKPAPPLFHSGCAMLARADLFRRLEGFDERFFMFADDVDLCLRAFVAGYDVRVVPEAVAWHYGGSATPGGYLTHEGISTTRFRLVLRERNTLAMLLKCYRRPLLAVAVPLYLAQTIATAAALALSGSRQAAREVLGGLLWNVRELPETMALRRRVQRSRRRSDRDLLRRMYRGWHKGAILLRHGLPAVDERRPVPAVASRRRTAARS